MARPSANLLATPADVGLPVRPNLQDYEPEADDDGRDLRLKLGTMVAPDNDDIIEWLRVGTTGDGGGEAIHGWYNGGWWVDISCVVQWEHGNSPRFYMAGDEGRHCVQIAKEVPRDIPSVQSRLDTWTDLMDRTFALLRMARDGLIPRVEMAENTYRYLMARTSDAARYLAPRDVRSARKRMRCAR